MTKKPSYRFAGYTEPWEEKKLGEVSDRYDNLRVPVSANERVSGNIPYYGANGIQDYVDGYTHDGEFILIAEDGASDLKDYPVQYVNGKVWVNNHAHVIQGKNDLINNIFLLFAVKQINIEPFLVGGGRAKLNSDVMMKLPLQLPSLPEQTAIGSFFQDIDQLISLQQRKLEVLKEQKKTYLKLLFPAKGQTKPALRFAGFEDEWKEVKLGEVGETYTGLSGKTKEDFGHGEGKFITYVNVFNNPLTDLYGLDSVEIDDKQRRVQYGDVLFTTSSETPEDVGLSSVWMGTEDNVYLNSFCFGYRPQKGIFDLYYLAFVLRSFSVRKEFMLLAQGISRFNISKTKVMDMSIHVPSLPEQEVIGSFFQDLDKAIAKQEEKVNQLKESKQTLLRKMFI